MDTNEKYALFKVKQTRYGIPVSQVREIINLTHKMSRTPNTSKNTLGIIDLRGKTIPVYDTRRIMAYDSLVEERASLISTLKQREQEHKNWLTELKACCVEKRDFTLQRNPHLCAFGKWYDLHAQDMSFSDDIRYHLKKFDQPHKEIHGLADEIDKLIRQGDHDEALRRIEFAESTTLFTMLCLFADFYGMMLKLQENDIALVVDYGDKVGAFPVDKIDSIDYLSEITPLSLFSSSKLVSNYGKKNGETILVLNLQAIFD